jgi:hypothetical protein
VTTACGTDLADGGVVSTCVAGSTAEAYPNISQLICGSADGG